MAVKTSQAGVMHHKSQIYDGFATIRSTRSRVRLKDSSSTQESSFSSCPNGHSEYFTLRRNNKKTFLENNNVGLFFKTPEILDPTKDPFKFVTPMNVFSEPIYAKVSPPQSNSNSPVKSKQNGRHEVHYDSIDIKPKRRENHRKEGQKRKDKDPAEARVHPIMQSVDSNDDVFLEKPVDAIFDKVPPFKTTNETFINDRIPYNHSDDLIKGEVIPYCEYSSKNESIISKDDGDDVLEELPTMMPRLCRSPQKYATLNSRRPKTIDIIPSHDNPSYYGSLNRARIGHCSEPNTPVSSIPLDTTRFSNGSVLPGPVDYSHPLSLSFGQQNGYQKKHSVRRSNSESGNLYANRNLPYSSTLPNYRHSVSVDVPSTGIHHLRNNHVCCECVTGIPAGRSILSPNGRPPGFERTLDTLYESQDPKVGCQTILRSKPPVPWWDLAIRKSRYNSCPILDEAHVVSAFEQSLSNMTQRLQQLTATAERKDSELTQLRQTIELLRKQSIQAGLTSAHMTSMGIKQDTVAGPGSTLKQDEMKHHNGSGNQVPNSNGSNMTRHLSTDSVSSLNSLSSGCSSAQDKKHRKKGWLRSSFTKAFSRNAKISKTSKHSSLSHLSSSSSQDRASVSGDHSIIREGSNENSIDGSREILAESSAGDRRHPLDGAEKHDGLSSAAVNGNSSNDGTDNSQCDPQLVDDLKKQLREKDLVLTDIRLEALSSAHQLESLKDTVIKMRNEMLNLKQNNERLQRLVRPRSLGGSHVSLGGTAGVNSAQAQSAGGGQGNHTHSQQNNNNCSSAQSEGESAAARRFSAADAHRTDAHDSNGHPQSNRDLDFDCATSTPTSHGYHHNKMGESPLDQHSDLYSRISRADDNNGDMDDLDDDGHLDMDDQERMDELRHCHAMGLLTNGSVLDEDPLLLTTGRLSGVDCDMASSVLAPPKCRELAMGETYADLGLTENSADIRDGKKIAIAVYLGQPDTFPRYFEEVCETLNSCEARFYSNRSSAAFPQHQEHQDLNPSSRTSMQSPDRELYQNITTGSKSNTNSLKSNKSAQNNSNTNVVIEHGSNHTAVNCNEFVVAYTYISGKTTWQNLDYTVRKTFKDYLSRIDPGTNLGLNTDSITSYHLGDATRGPEIGFPELLPCGYIIGTVKTLYICLQGVGSLAFDSLIPKNIVYRYVSLLSEHRRVILCGPSGTGKSYLAARLAEFHVARTASHLNPAEAIATFNVEHKSSKELRQYLSNMAEQCGETEAALPSVLILDNLHHASALADVFSGLLGARRTTLPCIIGTMSQATCNTTNLQLHHNFRWLLTANHMEPVKGFLARYLRRKQLVAELGGAARCPRLSTVLEWLPSVWQHVNSFLEAHSSSDVTVGPRLFLGCPLELAASQAWFTSVWNFSVIPYLIEAAREGVALYGRRGAWSDPVKHVRDTYPWSDPVAAQNLRGISLEDIGLDGNSNDNSATNNQDPLLNMLMRLQEAANYSGNHSQDSDNASLDSNLTHDSSVGNEL